MKRKSKLFVIMALTAICVFVLAVGTSFAEEKLTSNSKTKDRTIQEVYNLYQSNNIYLSNNEFEMFETKPVLEQGSYNPGKLSDEAVTKTIEQLNYYRKLAGLNNNITADPDYMEWGQYGATSLEIVGDLTHHFKTGQLETLSGYMDYDEVDLDASHDYNNNNNPVTHDDAANFKALAKARLAIGAYSYRDSSNNIILWNANCHEMNNVVESVRSYIQDKDNTSNGVGHRENMLDINGQSARFGAGKDKYSCLQVGGNPFRDDNPNTEAYYSWPCEGYFPVQEIDEGALWSIAVSKNYKLPDDTSNINVTLTYNGTEYAGSIVTAKNKYNGAYPCISYKLDPELSNAIYAENVYKNAGEADVTVKITGLRKNDDSNSDVTVEYTTKLFKEVPVPMTGIDLKDGDNNTEGSIQIGGTKVLNVTYTPEETTDDKTVTWTSSDEDVATVSDKGVVTGKKAGTADITATVGSFTKTYKITVTAKPISSCTISDIEVQTYSGSPLEPAITVKDGDTTLTADTDYTVEYTNNTNAGTAAVTITGKGNYSGTTSKNFTINAKKLNDSMIQDIEAKTYTGNEIKPDIIVKDGDTTLTADTDYTAAYTDNTNAGTATVTIKGKGNYTGTASKKFTINAKDLNDSMIQDIEAKTYTGNEIKPEVIVKDGDTTLTADTDYTAAYTNNTNAGTAAVTIRGKGNYTGNASKNFTINAVDLSNCTVQDISDQGYTGNEIKPKVIVKNGDTTLKAGTDYTVEYENNTEIGTGKANITGKGNYTGTVYKEFNIKAKDLNDCTIQDIEDQDYTGSEIKPEITVKNGDKTLTAGTDYTVSYENNKEIGTATVNITGKGNYTGTVTKTFHIVHFITSSEKTDLEKQITEAVIKSLESGSMQKPDSIGDITINGKKLEKGTDYDVDYSGFGKPGEATVTVTFKGNYKGTVTVKTMIPDNGDNASGNTGETSTTPAITPSSNGTTTVTPTNPKKDDTVTIKTVPNNGYEVGSVTVTDKDGKAVTLKNNGDGTYSFTQPEGSVTITVTYQKKEETITPVVESTPVLNIKAKSVGKTAKKFTWKKVKNADGYDIYFAKCGKKFKKIKSTKKTTFLKKHLKNRQNYKFKVRAYKMVDGKKVYLTSSCAAHVIAGGYNSKYTEAKKIYAKKKSVTLSVGKTAALKAKQTKLKKNRRFLKASHAALFRYRSSDKSVATVSKSGKVTAKKAGTCTIYIYAQNGLAAAVKVTVK